MKRIAIVAGLALGLAAVPATAQETEAESRYLEFQEAIAAVKTCFDLTFDQDQSTRLNDRVMDLVGGRIGPGAKLTLIRDARATVDRLDGVGGTPDCSVPPLSDMVGLYRQHLNDVVALPAG